MRSLRRQFMFAACACTLAVRAEAQLVFTENSGTATVQTLYGPGSFLPPQTVQTTFGPFGGAAVSDLTVGPFGRMRAVQTGYGLNAVSVEALVQDLPFFDWSARTTYDVEVEDASNAGNSVDFEYHLNGGRLELFDPSEMFDGMLSRVSVSIFTISPNFAGFLWSWVLTMRGSQGVVSTSVDIFIDPLGFGLPAMSPITVANGRASLSIGAHTARTNLGVLSNSSAFVTYDMDAVVAGRGFGEGGVARLGDPFDASGNYGAGITLTAAPTVAPEPATLLLLGTGLIGLGAARRARRITNDFNRS